jgi:hypothetical protein
MAYLELLFSRAEGGDEADFSFQQWPYIRTEEKTTFGPSTFDWSKQQLDDLTTLFTGEAADGARHRIGRELSELLHGLEWQPPTEEIERSDETGEELIFTIHSTAPELYTLPWELVPTDASDMHLANHPSVLIRHCVPGLPACPPPATPEHPGILFAWSDAAGRVPMRS